MLWDTVASCCLPMELPFRSPGIFSRPFPPPLYPLKTYSASVEMAAPVLPGGEHTVRNKEELYLREGRSLLSCLHATDPFLT